MATNTIKIVKSVVGYIIFTLRAQNVHFQHVRCRQTETRHQERVEQSESRCSLNMRLVK